MVFNSAEPFDIDLSLADLGPSSLTSDREIRLNLENGAVWDSNVTDIIVKDKRANILNGEKIKIDHTMSTLILTFKEDILSKEISIENSILSATKINYENKKLNQLKEMDTLYIIQKPSFPVESSYPSKVISLIVFSFAFLITTLLLYYWKNYKHIETKFV